MKWLSALTLAASGTAWAQGCQVGWSGWPGIRQPTATVDCFLEHDDGSGLALYAGGNFIGGGYDARILRWTGTVWEAFAPTLSSGVICMAPLHGQLYVGGTFIHAGSLHVDCIARWDGAGWSALGQGIWGGPRQVNDMLTFDDGTGPALYVAGQLPMAGGVLAGGIARWTGTIWQNVGQPNPSNSTWVLALGAFDDGSGMRLYAGGQFTSLGGVAANGVARWDGTSWEAVGTAIIPSPYGIMSFCAYPQDPSGPRLYAGGDFLLAGATGVRGIARLNGAEWEAVGTGSAASTGGKIVECMRVFDDGSGGQLYVGGSFTHFNGVPSRGIARWNGRAWSTPGGPLDGNVYALGTSGALPGRSLAVGGTFARAGGDPVPHGLALWNVCQCYADCDQSGASPALNVADFSCFLQRFAVYDFYANCDGSTQYPVMRVEDFACFLTRYAAGCP
ncbi:MAG: hypothetical protein WD749_11395 [Phycisphaerales bacterium]